MPTTNPVWCTHACDNTQQYSMRCTYRRCLHAHISGAQERPHTQYKYGTRWSMSTRTTTPSTTTQGGTQGPAGPDGLGGPGSREHAPGTPSPRATQRVHSKHQEPTTHNDTNYDPGTAGTTGPLGGETIRRGATQRQLEPEPNQTPSQRTEYSATSRTASTVTRQRTPSQDRTKYSQNTNYSQITRGGTYDPEQDPNPSQHTDYSTRAMNQTTNATPCRRTPSPDRTEYSAKRHRPLQHASPRSAAPRQPGQLPRTGTTNGHNGREDNTAKRARGTRTRSTTVPVQ